MPLQLSRVGIEGYDAARVEIVARPDIAVPTIARRLQRLEEGFGLGPETEQDRQLRELIKAAHRRAAERRAREGLPPLETDERQREDLTGLSIVQILQRGRARAPANAWDNDRA